MHERQRGVAQALRRIQAFLDVHAEVLGGINDTGARRQLDAIADRLAALESEQDPFGYQRERVRALIARLRLFHMRPIAAIARARLRESPEYAKLRVPPVRIDPGTAVLLAHEMRKAAEPHAPFFVATGLPADFLERLDDAAAAVHDAAMTRGRDRAERIGATAALRVEVSAARSLIAILDALVVPCIVDDPALLAEWQATKKVAVRTTPDGEGTPPQGAIAPIMLSVAA